MERLKDKLFNFGKDWINSLITLANCSFIDYWDVTNPNQYDITIYDLKLCQTTTTTKQLAHKALSTDIQTLKNAFPDNKNMVKFLNVIDKKLSVSYFSFDYYVIHNLIIFPVYQGISKDKVNVDFWNTTAIKLWNEQMKRVEIQESIQSTMKEKCMFNTCCEIGKIE